MRCDESGFERVLRGGIAFEHSATAVAAAARPKARRETVGSWVRTR
jgi:hypothetical protein